MRLALGIEYDGSPFCGWQSQPGGCGVQDHLEKALQAMAGHPLRVVAAGRTDTGVHAMMQVAHFDTDTDRPLSAWVRGINSMLPAAIRVLWAQQVEHDFHARFSAFERSYIYLLFNTPVSPAIMYGKAGWFHAPLDVDLMHQASQYLLGEHDFSAFRAAECQAKSPVRQMHEANVRTKEGAIVFEFRANAFLHHQVRNMVGALVYIGKGKYAPEYMTDLLESRDRTTAPPTFSPAGLYLAGIGYEARWGLPETRRHLGYFP
jgi:tRNA pseudouridine38-40 synthase